MTTINAIDLLRSRGYVIGVDPEPDLPFCSYYLQRRDGCGPLHAGLTAASLRSFAAYGVPSRAE